MTGPPDSLAGAFAQAIPIAVIKKNAIQFRFKDAADCLLGYLIPDGREGQETLFLRIFCFGDGDLQ